MFLGVVADEYWLSDGLTLLLLPAIVIGNGLFVAAEFALVALRKTRVEEMVQQNVKGAKAVERAVQRLDRSIAATQLGITLMSIALGWVGEPVMARLILPLFGFLSEAGSAAAAHTLATLTAFFLVTYVHVVLGELVPKNVALQLPDRTAIWLAVPLLYFSRAARPLIMLMTGTANFILRRIGLPATADSESAHSVEELLLVIEDSEEAGVLDEDQAAFVQNVFRLSNKHVGDCLVSRDKMASLELSTPPDKVLELVRRGAHTRMPVYDGEPDRVVGIVNTKDLFYLFSLRGVVILEDALYPALFVKASDSMESALRLFRKEKRHMAVVRDDENKVLGLITLEDVLEEIVGDIEDEHDQPTPKLRIRVKRTAKPTSTQTRPV